MALYLQRDGVDDRFDTPLMTFDEVLIDFSKDVDQSSSGTTYYLIDARNKYDGTYSNGYINKTAKNWETYTIDGQVAPTLNDLEPDKRVVARLKTTNPITANPKIFTYYTGGYQVMRGKIYDVKFLNAGALVAHYDMSTQTAQDQSGNGNHATLTGGTWVDDGVGGGIDGSITLGLTQQIYKDSSINLDLVQSIFKDSSVTLPLNQVIYREGEVPLWLIQNITDINGTEGYITLALTQDIYKDSDTTLPLVQQMYTEGQAVLDLTQTFYEKTYVNIVYFNVEFTDSLDFEIECTDRLDFEVDF